MRLKSDRENFGLAQISVSLADGRHIAFDVDTNRIGPAFFVLGVRKSGSSLLNNICKALGQFAGHRLINVGGDLFFANINVPAWQNDPALATILRPGNLYGGFRNMPFGMAHHPLFADGRKILLIRDPRDALVSEYFSNAFSHPIPPPSATGNAVTSLLERERAATQVTEIDDYVLRRAKLMVGTMLEYVDVAKMPSTLLLKYEDYIFEKPALIQLIANHFAWRINDGFIDKIISWADVRPTQEEPTAFIRKVTPGDYKAKLRSATIDRLQDLVKPAMDAFGYTL
jgi:hypothetical protein